MFGKVKAGLGIVKALGIAHAPAALFIGGIILVGAAIVETVKASTNRENIAEIEDSVEELETANEAIVEASKDETVTEKDIKELKAQKRGAMRNVVKVFGKRFIKPIILFITAIIFLICGFWWQSQRLAAAAAAACAATTALNTVNNNIRKIGGDAMVRAFNSPDFNPDEVPGLIEYTADGKKKYTFDGDAWRQYNKCHKLKLSNSFNFLYNRENVDPEFFDNDILQRLKDIQRIQSYLNMKLNMPGTRYITVNEALKELGLNTSLSAEGHVAGWMKGDVIDFGINEYLYAISDIGAIELQDLYDEEAANDGIYIMMNPRAYILDSVFPSLTEVREVRA